MNIMHEKLNHNKTLLVVEDDYYIGDLIKQFLIAYGYNVILATAVKDALSQCKRKKIDAVILDYVLPDAAGEEIFNYFQKLNIPIIVTSIRSRETVARSLKTEKFYFIQKPFDLQTLANLIQPLLSKKNGRANSSSDKSKNHPQNCLSLCCCS